MNCPICNTPLRDDERLALTWLPQHGHWILEHVVPESSDRLSVGDKFVSKRHPGFVQYCGRAGHYWITTTRE